MQFSLFQPDRRRWLQRVSLLTAGVANVAIAQSNTPTSSNRSFSIAQVVDMSPEQQDVSSDFLVGSRAAWQDINARGGILGRKVDHLVLETDGTSASLRKALVTIRDNPSCLALSGSVGDRIASQIVGLSRQGELALAHAAPWLQNSSLDIDDKTFPIFAARQEQIAYALKTAAITGVRELGVVYGSPQDQAIYRPEIERIGVNLQIRLETFSNNGGLRMLGQQLTPETPAVLLFVGGTPELSELAQGLQRQSRQRYVVALADVNLQTLRQFNTTRGTPVIATQPVPMVNSSLPLVMRYRAVLSRLFDEPPSSLSLAGFIAARFTSEVLSSVVGNMTRSSVLGAFQQRANLDLGGFRVAFNAQRRSNGFVTQSMMASDGRLIG